MTKNTPKTTDTNANTIAKHSHLLRSEINKLQQMKPTSIDSKSDSNGMNKKMDDLLQDINKDFQGINKDLSSLHKKINDLHTFVTATADNVSELEKRVVKLEQLDSRVKQLEKFLTQQETTYASITNNINNNDQLTPNSTSSSTRLDKLEWASSEIERKKRILQVTLSHPEINTDQPNLSSYAIEFMRTSMKMPAREIDLNLFAQKGFKPNSLLITLTDMRFKKLLFSTKKKLRVQEEDINPNLFINEYLTSHNLNLLMNLKKLRRQRALENLPCYTSVYSFDGKIFVKLDRNDNNIASIQVKTAPDIASLLNRLEEQ